MDNDGNFVFEPAEGNQGSVVVAEGNDGLNRKLRVNDGERGGFSGSRLNPIRPNPVTEFDGTHEVALDSLVEVANTVFNIEDGVHHSIPP